VLSSDDDDEDSIPPKKKIAVVSKPSGKPRTSMSRTKSKKQEEEDSDFEMGSPEAEQCDDDGDDPKKAEGKKPVKRKSIPKNAEATSSKSKTEKSKLVRDTDMAHKEPTKKFECVTLATSLRLTDLTCTAGLPKRRLD